MRCLTDSRSERVVVERGSIAYSAVTQPLPEPLRQRGTPSVKEAWHSTLVPPNSTRTLPSPTSRKLRVMVTGRSWSGRRPSARVADMVPSLSAVTSAAVRGSRQHRLDALGPRAATCLVADVDATELGRPRVVLRLDDEEHAHLGARFDDGIHGVDGPLHEGRAEGQLARERPAPCPDELVASHALVVDQGARLVEVAPLEGGRGDGHGILAASAEDDPEHRAFGPGRRALGGHLDTFPRSLEGAGAVGARGEPAGPGEHQCECSCPQSSATHAAPSSLER